MHLNIQAVNGVRRSVDISNDPVYFRINSNTVQNTVYGRAQVIPRKDQLKTHTVALGDQSAQLNVREYHIDKSKEEGSGIVTQFIGGRTLKALSKAVEGVDMYAIDWTEFQEKYKTALNKLYT